MLLNISTTFNLYTFISAVKPYLNEKIYYSSLSNLSLLKSIILIYILILNLFNSINDTKKIYLKQKCLSIFYYGITNKNYNNQDQFK